MTSLFYLLNSSLLFLSLLRPLLIFHPPVNESPFCLTQTPASAVREEVVNPSSGGGPEMQQGLDGGCCSPDAGTAEPKRGASTAKHSQRLAAGSAMQANSFQQFLRVNLSFIPCLDCFSFATLNSSLIATVKRLQTAQNLCTIVALLIRRPVKVGRCSALLFPLPTLSFAPLPPSILLFLSSGGGDP